MSNIEIVMYILGAICLIAGLLLSNNGSTSGLSSLSGQDLEIFKKTKDRGFVKFLQILMFVLMILFLIVGIISRFV